MISRSKVLMSATAVTVLVSFGWLAVNGRLWMELEEARRDPVGYLSRLADDVRLPLSSGDRKDVRQAADAAARVRAGVAASAVPAFPSAAPRLHTGASEAAALRGIADSLEPFTTRSGLDRQALAAALTQAVGQLESVQGAARADFAGLEQWARDAALPSVILERHQAAKTGFEAGMAQVFQDLGRARVARTNDALQSALASALGQLRRSSQERPHQRIDPTQLPSRLAPSPRLQTAEAPASTGESGGRTAMALAKTLPPAPTDLAATEDAVLTEDVRALARSLDNQPVRIFNWVRNNIRFLPTHGSVQGAQMTLEARRGNAYDTASLLVALLRAAGVPARYVMGTVHVPAAAAMNWVGGAPTALVAQQLFALGGVPVVALTQGGVITHLELEHVWVEAFVDFEPSRGAAHRAGDTWVPMDASFKQHTFTSRSSVFTDLPLAEVLTPELHLFDEDLALGQVTNVDDTVLRERVSAWADKGTEYFYANGTPKRVEDLLGGKSILQEEPTVLSSSLPYRLVSRAPAVSALPASVRHSVLLQGYASDLDRAMEMPSLSVRVSLPALNSRRLGLQFDTASQADADTLAAARAGGAGALPVYLINVVPRVKVDGVTVGSGQAQRMGSSFYLDVTLQGPDGTTVLPYEVVAGDEIVVGVTGNGVTQEVVEKRFASNPVDNASEYLHQVQLHYWAQSDLLAEMTARGMDVHMLRLPSVGLFSSPLEVTSLFGIPRYGFYRDQAMDVKQTLLGATSERPSDVVAFMMQAGMQSSYLEGAVFDQLKDRSNGLVRRGLSSMHLIASAMEQGIPIYRITQANAAAVLPRLALDADVERDISLAVSSGKSVLTSERNVDLGVWRGVGYIIQDDTTGAGAYMISGGLAGGKFLKCLEKLIPVFEAFGYAMLALAALLFLIFLFGALGPLIGAAVAGAGAGAGAGGLATAGAAILLFLMNREMLMSVDSTEA